MQQGILTTKSRLEGPDVWQFRWSEKAPKAMRWISPRSSMSASVSAE